MTTTTAPAESATDALPDEAYELAERVLDAMAYSPRTGCAYSPSMIARWVKVNTAALRGSGVLDALVADGNLVTEGNAAWTNYRFARG